MESWYLCPPRLLQGKPVFLLSGKAPDSKKTCLIRDVFVCRMWISLYPVCLWRTIPWNALRSHQAAALVTSPPSPACGRARLIAWKPLITNRGGAVLPFVVKNRVLHQGSASGASLIVLRRTRLANNILTASTPNLTRIFYQALQVWHMRGRESFPFLIVAHLSPGLWGCTYTGS